MPYGLSDIDRIAGITKYEPNRLRSLLGGVCEKGLVTDLVIEGIIGLCSCRHTKHHVGEKKCATPLDTCSSFGAPADYLIRNKLAREVAKSEMQENLARSRELGLVLSADNVKRNITFICHCCACCCEPLSAITKHGYTGTMVTSSFIVAHSLVDWGQVNNAPRLSPGCAAEWARSTHPAPPSPKRVTPSRASPAWSRRVRVPRPERELGKS